MNPIVRILLDQLLKYLEANPQVLQDVFKWIEGQIRAHQAPANVPAAQ